MAKGRGSALVAALLLCMVVFHTEMAHAAVYNVGGPGGWKFNVAAWPRGRRFRAGDVLVFNYPRGAHDVVAVNKVGYNTCKSPRGAKIYGTGKDRIKLVKGQNFFICGLPGHCQGGMKLAINAM